MIISISLFNSIILILCAIIAGTAVGVAISILNYRYNYKCTWIYLENSNCYQTSCKLSYSFLSIGNYIKNSNFYYCPLCGRKINESY
jgi:hypothetical protein